MRIPWSVALPAADGITDMLSRPCTILLVFMLASVCGTPAPAEDGPLLVEAESFDDLDGWVVDQQFMDLMGSPFLLAHGMGIPVADARTTT